MYVYSAKTIYNISPLNRPTEIRHIARNQVVNTHAVSLMNEFTKVNMVNP